MTEKHANLELWKSAPLAEINHPHPKNPRVIPDADSEEVRTLDASLEHDYFDPLIWNKRNRMWVSGHVRAWRMTALGFTHADVFVVDYDEETHLARMLAANAHSGKNDEDKLDALLASLRDASVDPVLALLSALPPAPPPPAGDADAEPDTDRAAELNKIWQVETGQIWQIGPHRLMCGSSTEAADVARLLDGAKPRLMITDPPYGVEYDPDWRLEAGINKPGQILASGKVMNDDMWDWTGAWKLSHRKQTSLWQIANMHRTQGDVDDGKTVHSTQKPVECMTRPMRNHSGDVHDPFLGSGTTMLAAQNLHRICYGMEISPDYCAVILDRMQRAFPDLEIKRVA